MIMIDVLIREMEATEEDIVEDSMNDEEEEEEDMIVMNHVSNEAQPILDGLHLNEAEENENVEGDMNLDVAAEIEEDIVLLFDVMSWDIMEI